MRLRKVVRYSLCFQQAVIAELESGRFDSIGQAQAHYGITGIGTIQRWLRRYGKNALLPKVVRVSRPGEAQEIRTLKQRILELERALGRTQAEKLLGEEFLKRACQELGQEVEAFKKKRGGRSCTKRPGEG